MFPNLDPVSDGVTRHCVSRPTAIALACQVQDGVLPPLFGDRLLGQGQLPMRDGVAASTAGTFRQAMSKPRL